jgi:hypothetical protein
MAVIASEAKQSVGLVKMSLKFFPINEQIASLRSQRQPFIYSFLNLMLLSVETQTTTVYNIQPTDTQIFLLSILIFKLKTVPLQSNF